MTAGPGSSGCARLVAAQHGRPGQAELLGDGRADAGVREVAVPVAHVEVPSEGCVCATKPAGFEPETGRWGQDSRMATTPWPPAAQIEIRPRLPEPASCSSLASVATIRPPVAANGWPAASEEPLTLSFDAVDRAQRRVEAELAPCRTPGPPRPSAWRAPARRTPRGSRRSRSPAGSGRCGRASAAPRRPAPSAGPRRRARSRRRRSAASTRCASTGRPCSAAHSSEAEQHGGGAVGQRRRVARRHRRRPRPCRTPA